jgi:SH3-like domain-containing protein
MKRILFSLAMILFCGSAFAQESLNNLPLPRWASLASAEVNLRVGPGERYPIDWVAKQKNMPVEIVQEFENWRKVKLQDGTTGWAHRAMLTGTRFATIKQGSQLLYRQPDDKTAVQAKAQKGALLRLEKCQKDWCLAGAQGFEGWVPKTGLWGVYADESFD